MSPELASVELDSRDGVAVATLTGEIDLSNASAIGQRLSDAATDTTLVIDVSELEYVDSAGIAMLHHVASRLGADQVRLVVSREAIVRRALTVAGVESILRIEESIDAAVESLRG